MHAVLLSIKKEIFMRVVVIIVHNKEILMRLAIAYIAIIRKYYNEKVVFSGGVYTNTSWHINAHYVKKLYTHEV